MYLFLSFSIIAFDLIYCVFLIVLLSLFVIYLGFCSIDVLLLMQTLYVCIYNFEFTEFSPPVEQGTQAFEASGCTILCCTRCVLKIKLSYSIIFHCRRQKSDYLYRIGLGQVSEAESFRTTKQAA